MWRPRGRWVARLTLMKRSLADGPCRTPVSRSENFFCAPLTYSSTLSYQCFITKAGVSLYTTH